VALKRTLVAQVGSSPAASRGRGTYEPCGPQANLGGPSRLKPCSFKGFHGHSHQCRLPDSGESLRALWSAATWGGQRGWPQTNPWSPQRPREPMGVRRPLTGVCSPSRLSLFPISTISARRIGVDCRPRGAPKRFQLYSGVFIADWLTRRSRAYTPLMCWLGNWPREIPEPRGARHRGVWTLCGSGSIWNSYSSSSRRSWASYDGRTGI
jgi:hypothetical protein